MDHRGSLSSYLFLFVLQMMHGSVKRSVAACLCDVCSFVCWDACQNMWCTRCRVWKGCVVHHARSVSDRVAVIAPAAAWQCKGGTCFRSRASLNLQSRPCSLPPPPFSQTHAYIFPPPSPRPSKLYLSCTSTVYQLCPNCCPFSLQQHTCV